MIVPQAFNTVCRRFHQDIFLTHPDETEMIKFALRAADPDELKILGGFLDELLSGRHMLAEIQKVWWSTPADIHFPDGEDVVTFLKLMRSQIP